MGVRTKLGEKRIMPPDYRIVYCFNGWTWIWRQLVLSLTSLKRFISDPNKVIVFYGPPRFEEHIEWLEPRCDLRLVDTPLHDPASINRRVIHKNKFYGSCMKIHSYELDTPNMFWVDCDTIIHGDLTEMLEPDFDILVSRWDHSEGKTLMKGLCKELNLPHMDIMMNGMLVFKNHAHNKMRDDYVGYLEDIFEGRLQVPVLNRMEIYAFMLSLIKFKQRGGKVVIMPPNWHQYAGGKYVQHLSRREIATWMEEKLFTPELYKLVEIGEAKSDW